MSECVENKGACNNPLGGNIGNIGNNRGCNTGTGGLFGRNKSTMLFFFLLLVIIFCNCGIFKGSGDSLLFFFLLLVLLFCGGELFRW